MLRHKVDVDPRWSPCGKHWAVYENETVHLRAGHVCERLLNLAGISRFEGLKLNPQRARRGLRVFQYILKLGCGKRSRLPEDSDAGLTLGGDRLFQELEALRCQFRVVLHCPCEVLTGPLEAVH
jgi:hypothetical protein